MSKANRIKERDRRNRLQRQRLEKEQATLAEMSDEEMTAAEEAALLELDDEEEPEVKELQKDVYADMEEMSYAYGPTTFEELQAARDAEKKAMMISDAGWDVQTLVHNIIHSPMLQGSEKADAIKKAGNDFGDIVTHIMDTPAQMLKESEQDDPEALEVEAIIAHDQRQMTIFEKAWQGLQKKTLSSGAREKLDASAFAIPEERKYPIHDKAHVRNALARAAQQIKKGGPGATDAKRALPRIRAAAKKLGIEVSMEKEGNAITIQKDANGDWRWVGWVSNNFIDRSKDILTEAAHVEYVDWVQKNMDRAPVFTSMHAPGTARANPVDFVGYENGFLVMSGKLTEPEAVGLMKVQKEYDLGMSHTGWAIRDKADPRQIVLYRLYEVTDLPVEMADNPFTELAVHTKEADMLSKEAQVEYLTKLLGSEERAKEALSLKTEAKAAELKAAGVEQKETPAEVVATTNVTNVFTPEAKSAPAVDIAEVIKQVGAEFDIEGLSEAFAQMNAQLDKLPVLEQLVKQQADTIQELKGSKEEDLIQMITPPAGRFAWSQKQRASQSEDTIVKGEEKEKLQKKVAGIPANDDYWLSQATSTAPVPSEA